MYKGTVHFVHDSLCFTEKENHIHFTGSQVLQIYLLRLFQFRAVPTSCSGFVQSPLFIPVSFSPHFLFRFRSVPTSHSGFVQSPLLIPVSFSPHLSFRFRSVPTFHSGIVQSPLFIPVSFSPHFSFRYRAVPPSHSGSVPVQVPSSLIIRCNSPPARMSPRMKFVTTKISSRIPHEVPLLQGIIGYNECKVVQPKAESAFQKHYHKP